MSTQAQVQSKSSKIVLTNYQNNYEHIMLTRTSEGILTVQLHTNNGPLIFALDVYEELISLFQNIAADRENKVVILTGSGNMFLGGANLGDPKVSGTPVGFDEYFWHCQRLGMRMLEVEAPIICALNGPVVLHNEIPLLCDVILADTNFYITDAVHLVGGIAPNDGMHIIWTELTGPSIARYYLWTKQKFSAQRCYELGVVHELFSDYSKVMERANAIAHDLSKLPSLTLRYTRQALTFKLKKAFLEQMGQMSLEGITVNDVFLPKK